MKNEIKESTTKKWTNALPLNMKNLKTNKLIVLHARIKNHAKAGDDAATQ